MPSRTRKKKSKVRSEIPFWENLEYRVWMLIAIWCLVILVVVGKLVYIQVLQHEHYRMAAKAHLEQRRAVAAQRGTISDRNGQLLAVDLIHYSLAVKPALLEDARGLATGVAGILGSKATAIQKKIRQGSSFVYLAHRVSYEKAAKLRALGYKGLILEKKFSRYYPYDETAAQLVGYCDYENEAKGGLELEYEKSLKGEPGWSVYVRDALGNRFQNPDMPAVEPLNGSDVELTIDMVYQTILEEELKKAVLSHQARDGAAVLMDPRSGELLGVANYPHFNPNQYNQHSIGRYRNRAITDVYEPGSTFKMVSLAVCLEQLNLDLDKELVFCENGKFKLRDKVVTDHQEFGWLTARQVFERSSNIGTIKLAAKFKAPIFYRYARDFGFGVPTGVDLPAEAAGILHRPGDYSKTSLPYLSIGYEVAVTPLQLAAAYGAIANDGVLLKPFVVKRVIGEGGQVVKANGPQEIRRVVSSETAARIREVLTGVVEQGTGKNAKVEGLSIAGKTGTSQTFDNETRSYSTKKHLASFVGMFPVEAPRFVLAIMINRPKRGYYGSQVAAPAFRNIALRIAGIPTTPRSKPAEVLHASANVSGLDSYMLSLEGLDLGKAVKMLRESDLAYELVGNGKVVYRQDPAPYTDLSRADRVRLFTEQKDVTPTQQMPSLTGKTLKEALQVLAEWNVEIEVSGSGVVVGQEPTAGQQMPENGPVRLMCKS